MLTKRVIPCLDVRGGRVTKGVKFKNNIDLGDPVEMAVAYSDGGADELVFYDITASAERRPIDIGMVAAVARTRLRCAIRQSSPTARRRSDASASCLEWIP